MRRWGPGPGEAPPSARRWLLILGVTVVALEVGVVVTTFVPAPHNGGDNAGYVTLARSLLEGGYVDLWDSLAPPHTKYPPVFPAILAGLVAVGATTWTALKAVPAVSVVLAVLLAYAWAARRRDPLFGAAVAALAGVSSAFVWSSHWILSDPTFLAFTFLALWALERSEGAETDPGGGAGEAGGSGDATEDRGPGRRTGWLVLGLAAGVLASFTRSAGLPLLVALGVWLALRRRWRELGMAAAVAGIPSVAWWFRARAVGAVQYVDEFWMLDPYQPALGRVGPGGLVARVGDNLVGYVGRWIPEGLVGASGPLVGLLGIVLAALAVMGWLRRVRRKPAVAELFFPLYAGLILLWPPVWSGDRFALPLFPLLLFYAGEEVLRAAALLPRSAARLATGAAALILLVPSLASWAGAVQDATACGAAFRARGTWACYGPAWTSFAEAARWSGANLPPGAAVLSRKPRLFYVLGGVPGRTFPFTDDPGAFLAEAGAARARYVVLDGLDVQATRFVGAVLRARPAAFCSVRSFPSDGGTATTRLLGMVPPGSGLGGGVVEREGRLTAALPACPPGLQPTEEVTPEPLHPSVVPLLAERPGVR